MKRYSLYEDARATFYCQAEELPQALADLLYELGPGYRIDTLRASKALMSYQLEVHVHFHK